MSKVLSHKNFFLKQRMFLSVSVESAYPSYGLVLETSEAIDALTQELKKPNSQMLAPHFLYLPGHVCRQADILNNAVAAGIPLVVERGVFLPPNDIPRLVEKLSGSTFALVECGSFNGYNDRVLDLRILESLCRYSPFVGLHKTLLQGAQLWAPPEHTQIWLDKLKHLFPLSFYVESLYDNTIIDPLG